MSNNEFHQRRLSATPRGVGVMCNFFAQSAENATLKDVEGNEYIDFAAGIAVLNTGHRHPDLVAAVEQQLQQFTHTAYQIVPYESYVTLAEKINALAPVSGQAKTAFFTTGAEAVENAVKIARAHTGRPGVIAFSGGFHGRTYMTMALTGKVAPYKIGFGPFPGSVYHVPYPSDLHGISTQDSLDAIERLFKSDIEAKQVAAIIFEPVQGEGGFNVAPKELAAAHAVLNIIDKESLCERANQLGQRLKNTLIDAKESVPAIAAVRGLGSMIAVEFNDPQTGEPSAAIAQKIQQRALAQGLLLLTCGAYGNVIRFLYPLTIPDAQFDAAMKILQDALSD
ncbi:TPA: aminotransferase class III-fold pyridoxal phosphate-dependent enzyme [Escherichia coli]